MASSTRYSRPRDWIVRYHLDTGKRSYDRVRRVAAHSASEAEKFVLDGLWKSWSFDSRKDVSYFLTGTSAAR